MYYVTESRGLLKKMAFGVCPHNSYDVPYIVRKPIVHKPRLVYRVTCHYHLKQFVFYCCSLSVVLCYYFFFLLCIQVTWSSPSFLPIYFTSQNISREGLEVEVLAAVYISLYNNQINQLCVIVPVNALKNRASSELLYKSNRAQVSMGYRLINHLGCW